MSFKSVKDAPVEGKRVLVRVDFNVPLTEGGQITDDTRIRVALPTIKHILIDKAKQVILMSHLGRPKGKLVESLKLDPVAKRLEKLLEEKVVKLDGCVDIEIPDTRIVLLENLRFDPGEKTNDPEFAKKLAAHADIYVNEAFSNSHRNHASMTGVTKHLPSYAGLELAHELKSLYDALQSPARPFIVVLGGVKLETKIPVIENMYEKADKLLLGGAMVFSFYKALGFEVGRSLVDEASIANAKRVFDKTKDRVVLPEDIVCAHAGDGTRNIVPYNDIPHDQIGLDIGPKTIAMYEHILEGAKTILWNGPMGKFEEKPFAEGTNKMAEVLGRAAENGAEVIVGGGDSVAAITSLGLEKKMSLVSTGGGASLEFFSGNKLPAIEALEQSE